jgi:hypothetical protein
VIRCEFSRNPLPRLLESHENFPETRSTADSFAPPTPCPTPQQLPQTAAAERPRVFVNDKKRGLWRLQERRRVSSQRRKRSRRRSPRSPTKNPPTTSQRRKRISTGHRETSQMKRSWSTSSFRTQQKSISTG